MHANFSNGAMRNSGKEETFTKICEAFGKQIPRHIDVYGADNDQRLTGAHETVINGSILNGSPLTALAFKTGLAPIFPYGDKIITLAVFLFAVSTAISWSYYGDRSASFLFGERAVLPYRLLYTLLVMVGAAVPLKLVWNIADITNILMALPNLLSLLLLAGLAQRPIGLCATLPWNYGRRRESPWCFHSYGPIPPGRYRSESPADH